MELIGMHFYAFLLFLIININITIKRFRTIFDIQSPKQKCTAFKCSVTATPNSARRYSTQDNINIFIDSRLGNALKLNAYNNEVVNIG